ncbi:hypothetical protein ACGO3R_07390 [Lactococcus lactis]
MLLFQMMGNAVINLPLLLTLLVVSFLFFIGFYFAEKRAVDPIVPLELFKNPSFIAKNIMFSCNMASLVFTQIICLLGDKESWAQRL